MKRLLDPVALHALARGCAVLGAGGGGDTYLALLQALQATEDFGPAALVDVDELPDDALIMPCGGIGAPTVSMEKIENGDEGERLRDHLQYLTGGRTFGPFVTSANLTPDAHGLPAGFTLNEFITSSGFRSAVTTE